MRLNPTVSIFLPTHNYGNFIFDSLESIVNQSYQNFELIFIDNNSTDNTLSILEEFKPILKDRLKYKYNPKNLGAEPSINKYLNDSVGELIAFQAGDDVWLPDKLEKQVSLFQKSPSVGLIYSNFYFWDVRNKNYDSLKLAHSKIMPSGNILKKLLMGNFIGATTVATTREALMKVGGFEQNLDLMGDYATWLKICRLYDILYIPDPLVKIRIHGNNLSLRKSVKMRSQEARFIRNFLLTSCKTQISFLNRTKIYISSVFRIFKGYAKATIQLLTFRT